MATVASFILFVSSLLDDAYYIRGRAGTLRRAFREITGKISPNATTGAKGGGRRRMVDMGWFQAMTISVAIPILAVLSFHYGWKFVDMKYGPAGPLLKLSNSYHSHTNMLQDMDAHNSFVEENSLCGLVGKLIGEAIKVVITDLDTLASSVFKKLSGFTDSVFHFSDIISKFEDAGNKSAVILEGAWDVAEKIIVLIIPLFISFLMTATTFILPRVSDTSKKEIEQTVKQLSLIGIYYNISMLVMMQQLFATISNMKLYIFYFRFEAGPLVPIGFIASGLNALALFSLYVNTIYRAEET
jgi:hypothetical protein